MQWARNAVQIHPATRRAICILPHFLRDARDA